MFEETTTYKRQQRRRAIIAWGGGGLVVLFFVLSIVFGDRHRSEEAPPQNTFGFTMSSDEYDSLDTGIGEAEFAERVENAGLPEDHFPPSYLRLFPPPAEGVSCSFWQISDRIEEVARICFSEADGHLVQKLERGLEEEELSVRA